MFLVVIPQWKDVILDCMFISNRPEKLSSKHTLKSQDRALLVSRLWLCSVEFTCLVFTLICRLDVKQFGLHMLFPTAGNRYHENWTPLGMYQTWCQFMFSWISKSKHHHPNSWVFYLPPWQPLGWQKNAKWNQFPVCAALYGKYIYRTVWQVYLHEYFPPNL